MERLRLWSYKKLTNEIVKQEKVIEKHSDDKDYNSCFKLGKTLKVKAQNLYNLLIYSAAPIAMSNRVTKRSFASSRDELIINEVLSCFSSFTALRHNNPRAIIPEQRNSIFVLKKVLS